MKQFAYTLAKPYLFVQGNNALRASNIFDKLRLRIAIALFFLSYKFDHKKDGSLFFAGKCYQSLDEHEKALKIFRKIWDKKSFNPILFKELGTACLRLKLFEEGLRYAQKEVSESPSNVEAIANLAQFLAKLNRIDEAYDAICRARDIDDSNKFVSGIYNFILQLRTDQVTPRGQVR